MKRLRSLKGRRKRWSTQKSVRLLFVPGRGRNGEVQSAAGRRQNLLSRKNLRKRRRRKERVPRDT
jgi:hypothetical protein